MQQGHNCNPGQKKSRASQEYQRGQSGGKYSKFVSRGGRQHRFTCVPRIGILETSCLTFRPGTGRWLRKETNFSLSGTFRCFRFQDGKGSCPPDGVKRCPQGKSPKLQI
ncbi:hypothetical protein CDAR_287601 [Caerostris darwini]|uniref:Uncharacterized protein n=1 Tax=Caerostris darwini TaxID=1538125 RepID=A0AAV4NE10_9ARAC|nr:hypothetical protein CDAR_287601 [Caerostris darwini]